MAQRDKTQGFGFVYVDIEKLMAQRDELTKERALHPQAQTAKTINLNRDPRPVAAAAELPASGGPELEQIREKLDRLQTLHHKLHAVLEELSTATSTDKKRRS